MTLPSVSVPLSSYVPPAETVTVEPSALAPEPLTLAELPLRLIFVAPLWSTVTSPSLASASRSAVVTVSAALSAAVVSAFVAAVVVSAQDVSVNASSARVSRTDTMVKTFFMIFSSLFMVFFDLIHSRFAFRLCLHDKART